MKRLVEEILTDMESPSYVNTEADSLLLIANYLQEILAEIRK